MGNVMTMEVDLPAPTFTHSFNKCLMKMITPSLPGDVLGSGIGT